jgi:ParB family chromosome partitioning protein
VPELPIADIRPSPYQPRREFDTEALNELADSIRTRGLLQPIMVRPRPQGGYELIAGERRWRAAQMAGLKTLAAVVRQANDHEASALALIENMQREDLNAMEEALGLARLRDEFELTQQQIADSVGKSRVAIANLLRLVNLGSVARALLQSGPLEMGHARALLALDGVQQDRAAEEVAAKALSVRQTEALVKRLANPNPREMDPPPHSKDSDTLRLERQLTEYLGAPVNIKHGRKGQGELVIKYTTLDELDGVLKHLGMGD